MDIDPCPLPSLLPEGYSAPFTASSPLTVDQRVNWSDLDSLGHVNNAVYLRWLENARFYYFELVGLSAWGREHGHGPILARTEIDYLAPVLFPDRMLIRTRTVRIGNSSFDLSNEIYSLSLRRSVIRARFVIVVVDYNNGATPVTVPPPVRAAIQALDGI